MDEEQRMGWIEDRGLDGWKTMDWMDDYRFFKIVRLVSVFLAEFTLLNKDGSAVGDALDAQQPMSLQEPLAIMRNSDVIMKIYDVMEKLNWEPYEVCSPVSVVMHRLNMDDYRKVGRACCLEYACKGSCLCSIDQIL